MNKQALTDVEPAPRPTCHFLRRTKRQDQARADVMLILLPSIALGLIVGSCLAGIIVFMLMHH